MSSVALGPCDDDMGAYACNDGSYEYDDRDYVGYVDSHDHGQCRDESYYSKGTKLANEGTQAPNMEPTLEDMMNMVASLTKRMDVMMGNGMVVPTQAQVKKILFVNLKVQYLNSTLQTF
ncbi:hypothetical protein HAX54_034835 [Datura stramonium]|uniref:Uncharacterized protein n=1 Tax=Datura stramonium TaxID=4076 RepID=A0ABS8SEN1_DATST|nr:hypothetical protein [Datura stramonium]